MFKYISNKIDYLNPINSILKNRGIVDIEEFKNPTEKNLENINNFGDVLIKGKELIEKAMLNNWNVTILFDCDVDGYTSGSLMYQVCVKLGLNTNYIFHDGKEHGLDDTTLEKIQNMNPKPKLLIIPDASTNDIEQITILLMLEINVLILDHHDLEINSSNIMINEYNDYFGIIDSNGNDVDCIIINNQIQNVEDKAMTGVGIVYKFVKYLEIHNFKVIADDYLDLVSLGMIGDVFNAKQLQSRYLVLKGLKQIKSKSNKNKFISYIRSNNIDDATITDIAFNYVPMINALIRLGEKEDKEYLIKAFINSNETVTDKIRGKGITTMSVQEYAYRRCEHFKRKQKKLVDESTQILNEQIEQFQLDTAPVIVCNAQGIDKSITGLIANKLTSMYSKSVIILSKVGDLLCGSARGKNDSGIKDFKSFCENTKLFSKLAGHSNAFGVSIEENKIQVLFDYLNTLNHTSTLVNVDALLTNYELNVNFVNNLLKYSYLWGCGVDEPKFVIKIDLDVKKIKVLNSKTITFQNNGLKYIMFNAPESLIDMDYFVNKNSIPCELLIKISKNTYNDVTSPQIIIENINSDYLEIPF